MPPSINLPQAILQANTEPDPLSISLPYYFRASLSDTELNTKRLSDASDFGGVAVSVLKGEKERPKSASATYRDGTLYGRQGTFSFVNIACLMTMFIVKTFFAPRQFLYDSKWVL